MKSVFCIIVAYAVFCFVCYAEELYDYRVYGQSKKTGFAVAGQLWETDKRGAVKAKVYDETLVLDNCNGTWSGRGIALVECGNGCKYVLKVVEE